MKIPIIFLVSLVDEIQSSPSSLPSSLCGGKFPKAHTMIPIDLIGGKIKQR
jgi:hypothetical protein